MLSYNSYVNLMELLSQLVMWTPVRPQNDEIGCDLCLVPVGGWSEP